MKSFYVVVDASYYVSLKLFPPNHCASKEICLQLTQLSSNVFFASVSLGVSVK